MEENASQPQPKPGRKLPWQDVVADPSDLPHKEVEATVRLEITCDTQETAEKVKSSFTWFNADGLLQEAVAGGPCSTWERDAPAAAEAPAVEGEAPPGTTQAWFEKTATVKATIDFARRLATQELLVSVAFPDPSWVPPVVEVPKTPKTPEKPPTGKKGKGAKEEKKSSGTKETLPGASKAEAPDKSVQIAIPLAPFLINTRKGEPPSAMEEGVDVVLACPGILAFKVHVRFSENLLSEEIKLHLNPMLVTLNALRKLPNDEQRGQRRHSVYAVLEAFGERRVADPHSLDAKGGASFRFHSVFFVGPWNQEHLREFLQKARFILEVRDRDGLVEEEKLRAAEMQRALVGSVRPSLVKSPVLDPPASPAPAGKAAVATPKGKAAPKSSGGKLAPGAPSAPATSPAPEPPPAPAAAPEGGAPQRPPVPAHGVARFSLQELLNPRHSAPLSLRPNVVHECKEKRSRAAGMFAGPLDVDLLFQRGTMEVLSSMTGTGNEPGATYLDSGAYASLTVSLSVPLEHVKKVQAVRKQEEKEMRRKEQLAREERAKELQQQQQQQQQQQMSRLASPKATPKAGAARPKSKAMARSTTAAEEALAAVPSPEPEPVVEKEPLDPRHERYGRLVLVIDYKKTTLVKRLIALVAEINIQALEMDPSEAVALQTKKLTDEQKADFNLDIITGFVVIDRGHRIIVVEGLRLGAMKRVCEELGRGTIKPTQKCKLLYHEGVGFSRRLYGDFNLTLRQVKLRQRTLEALLCRPTLYDRSRRGDEAIETLHSLHEIKKAERMHALKSGDFFPEASAVVAVETQYGAFVSDEELMGGRVPHDDDQSGTQGKSLHTGSELGRSCEHRAKDIEVTSKPRGSGSTARHSAKLGAAAALAATPTESDDSESEREEAGLPRNPRITMKAPLDATNAAFVQTLKVRASQPAPSMNERHTEALRQRSEDNAKHNAATRKPPDVTFLEGKPVHIYSGQKLNSAELQKNALREKMAGKEGQSLWTYAGEFNSGNFPMLEKDIQLSDMLRQPDLAKMTRDPREPWRFPRPREAADYRKMPTDVSEGRKDDLRQAWIENQLYPELTQKEVVKGAFDAKNLGTGGAHVIPERRPGLQEPFAPPTPPPEKTDARPPMAFASGFGATQMPSISDKYKRGLLDGPAQSRGIRFEARKVPRDLAKKYGRGPAQQALEVPPASINAQEEYREFSSTSQHLQDFMATVSRPLAAPGAFAATGVHTLRIDPPSPSRMQTLKLTGTGKNQPPNSARQAGSRPPRAVATLSLSTPLSAR